MLLAISSTLVLGQNSNKPFFNETVLFKITDTNSDRVSYLFGTHHAFGQTFFDSLVIANQALSSCQILIKENLNIPGHSAEDIINSRPNGIQWNKYLNKEDLNFVNTLFANSPTDYNKMTPTEMYVFLTRHFKQQICLSKEDTDTFLSLDDYMRLKHKMAI
ncbi:TraB/GumN family protein [Flagellimonas profundi]|uniref:TraB/GumN family protein n=1 Tax=Flagellimonas profundi TaxID=2915620 RepID=A0ABS3FAL9_9FLAO|nr:TraB/GumN family protein [Allomuricauda profundi]MBO0340205.1 TraB/GumN family protein [Allomuricauda profundi]